MSTTPLVSVVMPAYNAGRFLSESIKSVLEQDLVNFEFIIINDGSHDGSARLIDEFAAKDDRIRAVHQENRGFVASLNRGLELARAPFIARMDADDVALPRRFSEQFRHISQCLTIGVLGGFIKIVDEHGAFIRLKRYPLRGPELSSYMDYVSPVAHPAVMLNADAVRRVGGYRSAFFPSDDYDLWLRLRDAGYAIENIPQPVLAYRRHTASVSYVFRRQQAIAAAVARASSRMRRSGLNDPIQDTVAVSMASFETMPYAYRPSQMEAFEIMHMSISLSSVDELRQCLRDYLKVSRAHGDRVSAARFLIRVAKGLIRNRRYGGAMSAIVRSVLMSPNAISTMPRF